MAFVVRRAVEFCETDMAGILHFSNFFRFMEAAEHAYLRACGLNVIMTWQGETVTFPRVSASCDYVKPARFQDVLDIEVRVEKIGRSKRSVFVRVYARRHGDCQRSNDGGTLPLTREGRRRRSSECQAGADGDSRRDTQEFRERRDQSWRRE
jgi:YbgC/YbaW family acyl-CoA thioester hydrolase